MFVWILTWLCTVLSWLLKVMVRLVEVLGATCVIKGVLLWLTVSYMFTRRLQISMFWKQDLTLQKQKGHSQRSKHNNLFDKSTQPLRLPPKVSCWCSWTDCVLCGKSSKCVIVTKGWLSVSMGVILLSASMVSILVSRSINSLLSAFSASMSLPSKSVVIFTCTKQKRENQRERNTLTDIQRPTSTLGILKHS